MGYLTNRLLSERRLTQEGICHVPFKYSTKAENIYLYCQDSAHPWGKGVVPEGKKNDVWNSSIILSCSECCILL